MTARLPALTILVLLGLLLTAPYSIAEAANGNYTVVDTGQEACYGNTGQITCPSAGEAFHGQDAQHTGAAPRYTANGDGTVTDNNTGLMWQKSPDLDGDGDIDATDKLSYSEALAGASSFNLAGYTDWRLPSIKEMYSLIDFSGVDPSGYGGADTSGLIPFIDTAAFDFGYGDTSAGERIIDSQLASSNLYVDVTMGGNETMFGVNFADGRIKGYGTGPMPGSNQDKGFYVMYVRDNTAYGVNSFTENGDGTITDEATGLMWTQDDSGAGMNWEEALTWVETQDAANHLGYSDWRLPNVKELQSIVDYTRSPGTTASPAIDPVFNTTAIVNEAGQMDFPAYWSGTTHANWTANNSGTYAAYVCFGRCMGYMNGNWMDVHGAGAQRSDPKSGDPANWPTGHGPQGDAIRIYNHVRLVRGGSSGLTASAATNAASYSDSGVAPGSIASVFGQNLSENTVSAEETPLPTTLDGLSISLTDGAGNQHDCGQFFVSPDQANFFVPSEAAVGTATLTLDGGDSGLATISVEIEQVNPGLFSMDSSGQGVGAILTLHVAADGTQTYGNAFSYDAGTEQFSTAPIDLGDGSDGVYLLLYGTGIRGYSALSEISVTIGGEAVPVIGAAGQGEYVGLDQVNVGPLPSSLAGRGRVTVKLTVDGVSANSVAVSFQ